MRTLGLPALLGIVALAGCQQQKQPAVDEGTLKSEIQRFERDINSATDVAQQEALITKFDDWIQKESESLFDREIGPRFSYYLRVIDNETGCNVTTQPDSARSVRVEMTFNVDHGGGYKKLCTATLKPLIVRNVYALFRE
jgi:hypothetical protein